MPDSSYRLTAPSGRVADEGEAAVEVTGGAVVVSPPSGRPLRLALADVAEVGEPRADTLRLGLEGGAALELRRLGPLHGRLLAQVAAARAGARCAALGLDGAGRPEVFAGAVDGQAAELRLYDDALVTVPRAGEPDKVPYPFVGRLLPDIWGDRLTVEVAGREPLAVERLVRRTAELVELLHRHRRRCAVQAADLLAGLLPGLGPLELRAAAGRLGDGAAAPRSALDAVDATIWPALLAAVATDERRGAVAALERLGEPWLGLKRLPGGERPAMLAFLLCPVDGRLVYEALNRPDPTVVYRADGPDELRARNRALDLAGFRPDGADGPRLPLLAALDAARLGRVEHGAGWAARLGALAGAPA